MELCGICHWKISVKHETRCGQSFCYLCIKRHLKSDDRCPGCRRRSCVTDVLRCREDNERFGGNDLEILNSLCRLKRYIKEEAKECKD
ncbi:zinc finger domain-containing protein [Encephalitozoon intestinalis ATCC 50506]|uniref:Zinc finger domain-containing protein n=1 Tax=Encephalitozoon intestinalis (strain ATCC 50506) TaxID=876142 RepID=E0S9C3_ENCIT|nr:zinc finger domain-containing protein [Encephalitozoon intestinalis ATCC 50506]ADM12187.1 zinc finger domain-containing protein [Encephalitozoon intestinalis ATCC 50506]UTX45994.1 putative U-BOX domain-containing protein [Encephalitozoon intestinalis]